MPDKVVNPVTDAIRSVIGEYERVLKDAPKKQAPKVMSELSARKNTSVAQWLKNNGIEQKDFEGLF